MSPRNLLTEWSRLLVRSLADAGVSDVVVCPGSRSTPFVWAAVGDERLRCRDVIDERAAAFFALGQARVTGRPSVVICTSGSAGAHFFPAVVEASSAFVPLIVVTADRPFELQSCGASQTTDQIALFGRHVRQFVELGEPDSSALPLKAMRRKINQAVFTTLHPVPGPVHINARARKPLEPVRAEDAEERALSGRVDALLHVPVARVAPARPQVDADTIRAVARECVSTEEGVIVCGPAAASDEATQGALFGLARLLGYPLLAEATSQVRFGPAGDDVVRIDLFDLLYQSRVFRQHATPRLALRVGGTPTSTGWELVASAAPDMHHVVISTHGWSDAHSNARFMLFGESSAVVAALRDEIIAQGAPTRTGDWLSSYKRSNDAVSRLVERRELTPLVLDEREAVRTAICAAPAGSILVIGNSLPVREADLFPGGEARPLRVVSQRGVAGIDGLVAGAAGAAHVDRGPVMLLLGDISLLHDLTSLSLARRAETPLVIVVIQNRGGRIFELLPVAKSATDDEMAHIVAPHDVDLEPIARGFHVSFERATTRSALEGALKSAYARQGCTVVEAIVPEHAARDSLAYILARLDTVIDSALFRHET